METIKSDKYEYHCYYYTRFFEGGGGTNSSKRYS